MQQYAFKFRNISNVTATPLIHLTMLRIFLPTIQPLPNSPINLNLILFAYFVSVSVLMLFDGVLCITFLCVY